MIMMMMMMMIADDDDAVADEAAVCQRRVSQHPDWKSKAAAEGELRKVDGESNFAMKCNQMPRDSRPEKNGW